MPPDTNSRATENIERATEQINHLFLFLVDLYNVHGGMDWLYLFGDRDVYTPSYIKSNLMDWVEKKTLAGSRVDFIRCPAYGDRRNTLDWSKKTIQIEPVRSSVLHTTSSADTSGNTSIAFQFLHEYLRRVSFIRPDGEKTKRTITIDPLRSFPLVDIVERFSKMNLFSFERDFGFIKTLIDDGKFFEVNTQNNDPAAWAISQRGIFIPHTSPAVPSFVGWDVFPWGKCRISDVDRGLFDIDEDHQLIIMFQSKIITQQAVNWMIENEIEVDFHHPHSFITDDSDRIGYLGAMASYVTQEAMGS